MTPANQLCEFMGPLVRRYLYSLILAWALNETACTPCCHALLPSHWRHLTNATPSHTLSALHRDSSLLCLTARSPLLLLLTLPDKSRECNETVEALSYWDQSQSTALPAATHAWMEEQGRSDLDVREARKLVMTLRLPRLGNLKLELITVRHLAAWN